MSRGGRKSGQHPRSRAARDADTAAGGQGIAIGERLTELREKAGLTGRELDALAGLRACHARSIENGSRQRIEGRTLAALATVLGCSMDWLYWGVGEPPTQAIVDAAVRVARRRSQRVA